MPLTSVHPLSQYSFRNGPGPLVPVSPSGAVAFEFLEWRGSGHSNQRQRPAGLIELEQLGLTASGRRLGRANGKMDFTDASFNQRKPR